MTRIIEKSKAVGTIKAPPSKSIAHRLLIGAAMCSGQRSVIYDLPSCEDVLATIDCLMAFGVNISYDGKSAVIDGIDFNSANAKRPLMCRESGSTLRFLLPLALLTGEEITLTGTKKLISRPQDVYEEIAENNCFLFRKTEDSITVKGKLSAGEYSIRGDVSSQFISGLVFALSSLNDDSKIKLTTKIESRSYIELTRSALSEFGVSVEWIDSSTLVIHGAGHLRSKNLSVEGDWSSTAFIEAFNYIGGKVKVIGLNESSLQGDKAYRE